MKRYRWTRNGMIGNTNEFSCDPGWSWISAEDAEKLKQMADDAAEDRIFYKERAEKLEAERKAICSLMNGNDDFPGDLVQYIKNEIDGRREAEAELADCEGENTRLQLEVAGAEKEARQDAQVHGAHVQMLAESRQREARLREALEELRVQVLNNEPRPCWPHKMYIALNAADRALSCKEE